MSTRYYNPNLGRFLNADALASTGQGMLGNNMFAYCGNNSVRFSDDSGYRYVANCGPDNLGTNKGDWKDIVDDFIQSYQNAPKPNIAGMGFWNKFDCFNSIYQSSSSVNECIASIVSEKTFGKDFYNPQYYDYKVLSSNQMLLVFKGAKFGKAVKTEYIATFYDNPKGCKIILAFQRELLCLPPMTPTCLLDLFMEQKIQAYRCQN